MTSQRIELKVQNSTSAISGLTREQHAALKRKLSYRINRQASYFSHDPSGGVRYLLTKQGSFPTGLLYIVKSFLDHRNIPHTALDARIKPISLKNFPSATLPHTPYEEQLLAASACVKHDRGIIVAPTGVGKSLMVALIIAKMGINTLVVVPSLELKRQLTETLKDAFGGRNVGGLGHLIAVENIQALSVKDKYPYDCIIIDEFHHSAAKTYRDLNQKSWNHVYHRFGMTATPYRSQSEERLLLESVLSRVIYRVEYSSAVQKGHIVPMDAYFLKVPKKSCDSHNWQVVYKQLVVNNAPRNEIISSLLGNLDSAGASTLCLVKEVAHGEALAELTGLKFAHGEAEDSVHLINQFSSGRLKSLIATTGVCGEGVDTRAAEYIVIAGLGKSRPSLMQQFGRGFRRYGDKESCKVILFKDSSHKFTISHFREQIRVLSEEYGIEATELVNNT